MQILSQGWLLATDPQNIGKTAGWFASGPTPDAQPAPVPGIIQQVYPDYHGVAWYWTRFTPAGAAAPGARWQLHFHGGVDYLGEVWLNGRYLGCYEGGEAPFDLDATAALQPGAENLLAVRVLNPTNEPIDGYLLKEVPHRNKANLPNPGSGFNYGGIGRPVELRAVPAVRILAAFVQPELGSGRVAVTVTLCNDSEETLPACLSATIGPAVAAGPAVLDEAAATLLLAPGETRADLTLHVSHPHAWNIDDPYLYRVGLRSEAQPAGGSTEGRQIEDEYGLRCGFREFYVERGFFRLNGKRLFLRSTHTGNHFPQGQSVPVDPDLVRRDLIMAKASGFNMVRFICGMALPEQLDFADELGLLIYEENMASWLLDDSPHMAERFDRSTDAMILSDRNHPSVVIWGLLNETKDGPVFRHAVDYLPHLRELDPTRLVLLSSGRWDCRWNVGSVSNPGRSEWEYEWGAEAADAAPAYWDGSWAGRTAPPAYFEGTGDAHIYPRTPQTEETNRFLRTLGHDSKPVFVSEYGIGSLFNVLRELRHFEQAGARPDLFDVACTRGWAERLTADWQRWGFDGVYPFLEDMLLDSQRLHARQRLLGFDVVRANPQINGYNLTGILDHALTGEGVWTFHREWKPGIVDVLTDGWAPVRWCLFVDPLHGYTGRKLHVEALLANEDVLPPGAYPVAFRISGSQGVVWERRIDLQLPEPPPGGDAPLAVPVLDVEISLDVPPGKYELAAYMEHGGAPTGGRLAFYLSHTAGGPPLAGTITTWGLDPEAESWLAGRGATLRAFAAAPAAGREIILVGAPTEDERDPAHFSDLARRVARGGCAVFLQPEGLAKDQDPVRWLPLENKGRRYWFNDWLYHKECVAKAHPVFAGLPAGRILDWDYYGPLIPHNLYDGQATPDEVMAAAFAPAFHIPGGYASGLLLAAYNFGAGRFILNTFPLLENLDRHPAADRLVLNLVQVAAGATQGAPADLPADFATVLQRLGYA